MRKEPVLVVMAAGMGSRYGGLKQIDPVGPNGEIILDYSIYDAIRGGFGKVVFIIRKDIEKDFKEVVSKRWEGKIEIDYVYQLAVTVDDGEAGVTEVVRGMDLLSSAPRQMYLQELFGFSHPEYGHVPMLLAPDGRRLSKRDKDLDLGILRQKMRPEELIGVLAYAGGLIDRRESVSASELAAEFSWDKLRKEDIYLSLT